MKRYKRVRTRLGWRWLTALGLAMSLIGGIMAADNARACSATASQSKTAPY